MSEQDKQPYKPFDSAFKTLAHDCPQLMIPVVNEAFGTAYAMRENVTQLAPNQLIPTADGDVETLEVDSLFTVGSDRRTTFHVECQSKNDNTMVVRFWRYDSNIAAMTAEITDDGVLRVRFPRSAVIYLRHGSTTPNSLRMQVERDDGICIDLYEIPVIKMQRYTLDELFDKGLYFLLAFYPFTHESRLPDYEADERRLDGLLHEIEVIKARLEDEVAAGKIDAYERWAILMMLHVVMRGLAWKQPKIMKGVDRTMGGVILDYEAKRILNRGRAEGIAEGEAKGELKTYIGLVRDNIMEPSVAAARLHISESEFRAKCDAVHNNVF